MPSLTRLDVSGNLLSSLGALASLRSLRYLSASANRIGALDGRLLEQCPKLQSVFARSNPPGDAAPTGEGLAGLAASLKELELAPAPAMPAAAAAEEAAAQMGELSPGVSNSAWLEANGLEVFAPVMRDNRPFGVFVRMQKEGTLRDALDKVTCPRPPKISAHCPPCGY